MRFLLGVRDGVKIKGTITARFWDAEKYPTYESTLQARARGEQPLKTIHGVHPRRLFGFVLPLPKLFWPKHNVIANAGMQHMLEILTGDEATFYTIDYCGVGSGSTAPVVGDTDLETAIGSRKAVTNPFRTNQTATFSTFYASADNNGTWREVITAWESSGGDILNHALFDAAFTKDTTKTATVDVDISLANA